MNRIYKVIWNKAKGCYQVASEFAHQQGRGGSTKSARHLAAVLAVTALLGGFSGIYVASAADQSSDVVTAGKVTVTGDKNNNFIVSGNGGQAVGDVTTAEQSIIISALGNAQNNGEKTIVQNTNETVAIGNGVKVTVSDDITNNDNTYYLYHANTVIGTHASAVDSGEGVALGSEASLENVKMGVAIGYGASVKNTKTDTFRSGSNGIALGPWAKVTDAPYGIAIGSNANVSAKNSVALGWKSNADEEWTIAVGNSNYGLRRIVHMADGTEDDNAATLGQTLHYKVNGTKEDVYGHAVADIDYGTVELTGAKDKNGKNIGTKLTNLAAGAITASSTDAISGGQLYAAGIIPGTVINDGAGEKNMPNIAIGTGSKSREWGSIAIGYYTNTTGKYSTALGMQANATALNSVAIGSKSRAVAERSLALGTDSVAADRDVVSVGHKKGDTLADGTKAKEDLFRKVTNVADGTFEENSHDAVTAGQLYAAGIVPGTIEAKPGDTANNSIAIGEKSKVTGNNSIAIGGQALSSADVVIGQDAQASGVNATAVGNNSHATKNSSTALGQNAWATAENSVALGAGSVANEANTVSVGNASGERRIVNVADGTKDTDAVNFKQLSDVDAKTQANADVLAAYKVAGVVSGTNNGQYNVVLGDSSFVNGQNSVAIGRRADVEANFGTAIGDNAQVYGVNSVAIGADSVASENNVVSVGSKDQTRKVVNVAAGVNANDAVNKGQLDAVDLVAQGASEKVGTADFARTNYATAATNATDAIYAVDSQAKANSDGILANRQKIQDNHDYTWKVEQRVAQGEQNTANAINTINKNVADGFNTINTNVANGFTEVNGKIATVETEAKKHTTLTEKTGNLNVVKTDKDGQANYDVSLSNHVTLQKDNNKVDLNGDEGTISVKNNSGIGSADFTSSTMDFNKDGLTIGKNYGVESAMVNANSTNINGGTITAKGTLDKSIKASDLVGGGILGSAIDKVVENAIGTSSIGIQDRTEINGGDITSTKESYEVKTEWKGFNGIEKETHKFDVSDKGVTFTKEESKIGVNQTGIFKFDPVNETTTSSTNIDGSHITAGTVKINGESGSTMTGLTNTKWDANGTYTAGRAATEEQLKGAYDDVSSKITETAATAKKHTTVKKGDNIELTEGKNADGGKEYTVSLAKDITVDSVTVNGEVKAGSANLGGVEVGGGNINAATASIGNLGVTGNLSASTATIKNLGVENNIYAKLGTIGGVGLENGNVTATTATIGGVQVSGNKVTGLADGTENTDAVNFKQLSDVQAEAAKKTTVTNADDNITVEKDGEQGYKVGLADNISVKDVQADSAKIGGFAIDNDSIYGMSADHASAVSIKAGEVAVGTPHGNTKIDGNGLTTDGTVHADKGLTVGTDNTDPVFTVDAKGNTDIDGHLYVGNNNQLKVSDNGDTTLDAKLTVTTKGQNGMSGITSNGDSVVLTATTGDSGTHYVSVNENGAVFGNSANKTTVIDGDTITTSKVTGLADGEVSANSKDAVNGSQLNAVKEEAAKKTTVTNADDNITVEKDGEQGYKVGLADNISVKDVQADSAKIGGFAIDNDSIYGMSADHASAVSIKAGEVAVGTPHGNTKIDGNGLTTDGTVHADKGLTVGTDNTDPVFTVDAKGNTDIDGHLYVGNNNQLKVSDNGDTTLDAKLTVTTKGQNGMSGITSNGDSVVLTATTGDSGTHYVSVNENGAVFGNSTNKLTVIDGDTITTSKVTGLADGEVSADSKDAVNGSQLNEVQSQVSTLDQNAVKWDEGTKDTIKGVQFGGNGELTAANITADKGTIGGVSFDGNGAFSTTVQVKDPNTLAGYSQSTLSFNENGFTVSNTTLGGTYATTINGGTVTTNKVTGLARGEVSATSTDAVNGSQLNEVQSQVSTLDKDSVKWDKDAQGNTTNKINGVGLENGKVTADNGISAGNGKFTVDENGNTTTNNLTVNGKFTLNGSEVATTGNIKDLSGAMGLKDGKVVLDNKGTSLTDGINKNANQIGLNEDGTYKEIKVTDTEGKTVTNLTDAVNANNDKIAATNKVIGATGEKGALNLTNGKDTVEKGINQNTADIQQNREAINSLGRGLSDLGEEVDNVGAISAALAGLHPLDYDGSGSKFQISAAVGTYDGTQAAALGGFYHFNRDVMMSLGASSSFGSDNKTAANLGVTFRVGQGADEAPASNSDVMARLAALEKSNAELQSTVKTLTSVLAVIDPSQQKVFPDVPENHWAYDAVAQLAGNGIVEGYPDGEFHGDRTMTRYEMAELIYKAMKKGAKVDQKLVNEFKTEISAAQAKDNAETATAAETKPAETAAAQAK